MMVGRVVFGGNPNQLLVFYVLQNKLFQIFFSINVHHQTTLK